MRDLALARRVIPVVVVSVAACVFAVASASAGGGNSDAAKMCQKGGWQNYARADGTTFKNTGACVSYAAHGFTLMPACAAGSENFSEYAEYSQPTTFSGGTIDTAYGSGGGVLVQDSSWGGAFPSGAHLLFSGFDVNQFQLTFTSVGVDSVQLDAESNIFSTANLTLTGYDASNNVVDSETLSDDQTGGPVADTLTVSSSSNNIKYFTIATDDPNQFGVGFTNINWACTS
jgi:hypothetical protein